MKFNVERWNGKVWEYVATVSASNEQEAAKAIAQRFNLTGRFASYPHIDSHIGQVTSKSLYTNI